MENTHISGSLRSPVLESTASFCLCCVSSGLEKKNKALGFGEQDKESAWQIASRITARLLFLSPLPIGTPEQALLPRGPHSHWQEPLEDPGMPLTPQLRRYSKPHSCRIQTPEEAPGISRPTPNLRYTRLMCLFPFLVQTNSTSPRMQGFEQGEMSFWAKVLPLRSEYPERKPQTGFTT